MVSSFTFDKPVPDPRSLILALRPLNGLIKRRGIHCEQLYVSRAHCLAANLMARGREQIELTDGQKACLRLVDDHHTSKEIARKLGISPFTVDQRLDAARRKLNASSRRDAAKMFVAMEHQSISQPFVYEPKQIVPTPDGSIPASHPNRVEQIFSRVFSAVSVPPIGGERHEFPKKDILVQSLNIAFFSTLVVAFSVVVLTGTFRLFQ